MSTGHEMGEYGGSDDEFWLNATVAETGRIMLQEGIEQAYAFSLSIGFENDKPELYEGLLESAANQLLYDLDIESQNVGLQYYSQRLERSGDLYDAEMAAELAGLLAKDPDNELVSQELFLIALELPKRITANTDFELTEEFIENILRISMHLEAAGFIDMQADVLRDYGMYAIEMAQKFNPVAANESAEALFIMLENIAVVLYDTQPDLAKLAYSLLPWDSREHVSSIVFSNVVFDLLHKQQYDLLRNLATGKDAPPLRRLWSEIVSRTQSQAIPARIWSEKTMETVLDVWPRLADTWTSPDLTEGQDFGMALGLMGRVDLLSLVISSAAEFEDCEQTVASAAYGFGYSFNQDGFYRFQMLLIDLGDEVRKEAVDLFNQAVIDAEEDNRHIALYN